MFLFTKNFQFGAAMLFSILLFSCSGDDDGSSNLGNEDFGEVTITLSGDLQGTRTGIADFNHLDLGNLHEWELSFNDYSPNTFDMSLILLGEDLPEVPSPGTYEIGFEPMSSNVFLGSFYNFINEDYDNAIEYSTMQSGGTLTIQTSNSERITGSFDFVAQSRDDYGNVLESVQISGTFSANKRLFAN